MNYNTNYRIIKTETKEVVHMNTSKACFSSFTSGTGNNFDPKLTMEVYQPNLTLDPRIEVVKRWIEDLTSLGFPMTMSTIEIQLKDPNYPQCLHERHNDVNTFYQFDLDFSKYTSKAHVKLALYLLRFIYECRMPDVLDEVYRLKDISPNDCSWELFQLASVNKSTGAMSGHYLINTYVSLIKIISIEELNKVVEKWTSMSYTGGEMMEVDRLARTSINPTVRAGAMKKYHENKDEITLEQYKKLIETAENGKQ